MSDRICAEIHIGGTIRRGQVRGLCRAIAEQGPTMDWGAATFLPRTGADLLAACRDQESVRVLWLCDDQAANGQFDDLEAWLRQTRIPFTRFTDASSCYDGERVDFRPGRPICVMPTNAYGQPVVPTDQLRPVVAGLKAACRSGLAPTEAKRLVRGAMKSLERSMGGRVPPLPPFGITASRKALR